MLTDKHPADFDAIRKQLNFDQGIPYDAVWSAEADYLQLLIDQVFQHQPEQILECGSGFTTLVMAAACRQVNAGHIFSLENGAEYAEQTIQVLKQYDLLEFVTVLDAPLIETQVGGQTFQWYSVDQLHAAVAKNTRFGLFSIDGPPGFLQKNSRYPALPIMQSYLAQGCVVTLDDAARDDERALVEQWQKEFPDSRFDYLDYKRGCVIGAFHA